MKTPESQSSDRAVSPHFHKQLSHATRDGSIGRGQEHTFTSAVDASNDLVIIALELHVDSIVFLCCYICEEIAAINPDLFFFRISMSLQRCGLFKV